MTPECLRLGTNLAAHGFTVYLPLMFGRPGAPSSALSIMWRLIALSFSSKWHVYEKAHTSPIVNDLKRIREEIVQRHGRVGVIGMCLTGAFPLALLEDQGVTAVVLSQPATPFMRITSAQRAALSISEDDLERAKRRVFRDNLEILGLRFASDNLCQAERFENLKDQFGTNFTDLTISLSDHPLRAHSVLCGDYDNTPMSATRVRFECVLSYLDKRFDTKVSNGANSGSY